MTENKYTTFINFLDNYSINESIVTGEYEVLRRFIRNNYENTNIKNIPKINCEYTPITNLTYVNPFFSMKPVQNREQTELNSPDISLNRYIAPVDTPIEKTKEENIDVEINTIRDLIELLNNYEYKEDTEYNIDLESLHKIKNELILLDEMVGLSSLKHSRTTFSLKIQCLLIISA